jgi:hypothetical protein
LHRDCHDACYADVCWRMLTYADVCGQSDAFCIVTAMTAANTATAADGYFVISRRYKL